MPDRITVAIAVPIDTALPLDVQGVGLRRKAIDLMSQVADVDESTVRYQRSSDVAVVRFGDTNVCAWQENLLVAQFYADGKVHRAFCGPVVKADRTDREYSAVSFTRSELD